MAALSMLPPYASLYEDDDGRIVNHATARQRIQDIKDGCKSFGSCTADWQYGCVPGRRREEATMVQMAHGQMPAHHKFFHVTTFYDGANAFLSIDQERTLEAARPPVLPHR